MNGLEFFGIGLPELITILIIAGLVMGPQRIAKVARQLGKWTTQLQAISRGFMQQLTSELDSAEKADLKEAMDELKDLRRQLTDLRSEMGTAVSKTTAEMNAIKQDLDQTIKPPELNEPKSIENGSSTPNGVSDPPSKRVEPEQLPNILEIDDDPDS